MPTKTTKAAATAKAGLTAAKTPKEKKPATVKAVKAPKAKAPAAAKAGLAAKTKEKAPVVAHEAAPAKMAKPKGGHYFYANGKRKTAIATVRLYANGTGTFSINERTLEGYFPVFTDQDKVLSPLRMTSTLKSFDITAHVSGGGIHAQADAVRHGISKALLEYDVAMRGTLKAAGFLTRDPRVKERKKYGLHRARRAPQFSKR